MAWSGSAIFASFVTSALNRSTTGAFDMDGDAFKVALFDSSLTPDKTDTAAHNSYAGAGGQWASGGVSDASGWPAAGRSLVTPTSAFSSSTYKFDADDTVSANNSTTLSATHGCLVYDDTASSPADQGCSYNYFGGANSVTAGTFTIVWNASGIFTIAV